MTLAFDHASPRVSITGATDAAADALLNAQQADGHWVFELEADATIPAEYILMRHYLGTIDEEDYPAIERRLARYLRDTQSEDGGWPLFYGGAVDISASVKAYKPRHHGAGRKSGPRFLRLNSTLPQFSRPTTFSAA